MKKLTLLLLIATSIASAQNELPVCGIKPFHQIWFSNIDQYVTESGTPTSSGEYFFNSYSSLPETGKPNEISTSTLNVIALLALHRCSERSFKVENLDSWIQQTAMEQWGREADETERLLAKELYYAGIEASGGNQKEHPAMLVCALFLSSPEGWIR